MSLRASADLDATASQIRINTCLTYEIKYPKRGLQKYVTLFCFILSLGSYSEPSERIGYRLFLHL